MSFFVGRGSRHRTFARLALAGVSLIACTDAVQAQAPVTKTAQRAFSVPAGSLEAGILKLGQQADLRLLYPSTLTNGKQTKGVSGTIATEAAVASLLDGTGLRDRIVGENPSWDNRTKTVVVTDARDRAI